MTHGFSWRDEVTKAEDQLLGGIETKVKASTTAAAVTGLVLSELGAFVFHTGVPNWAELAVTGVVGTVLTGAATFIAGYRAKHTSRTPPAPPKAADEPPLT